MDTEALKKKYFDYVNHDLPQDLLPGIEKAMEIYAEIYEDHGEDFDENAVCLIIDDNTLAFATGDGLDVDGEDDDSIFYKYKCDMLATCAEWCEEAGMNLKQEVGHWLGDAITLAAEEGLFDSMENFCVYGDFGYGAGEYDVFYEAFDDEDDDWDEDFDDDDIEEEDE